MPEEQRPGAPVPAGRHVAAGAFPFPELATVSLPVDLAPLARRLPDARARGVLADRAVLALNSTGVAAALTLSGLGWAWLRRHGTADRAATSSPAAPDGTGATAGHWLATLPGPTLVLMMILVAALLAPVVNPFYTSPSTHRVLHRFTVGAFAVLAATTIGVVAVVAA